MEPLRVPVTMNELAESVRELLSWAESVAGHKVSPGVVKGGGIFIEARNRLLRLKPTTDELAGMLNAAYEHMADSLPYFPSDGERDGEETLSREIEDVLARHRRYS